MNVFLKKLPRNAQNFSADRPDNGSDAPPVEQWSSPREEGQLAVDVLETAVDIIVVAAMAGTKPDDMSIHLQDDLLTIRGYRKAPLDEPTTAFYQECYWGPFSRSIVLPMEVREESVRAEYRNGILTIRLEKSRNEAKIPIIVVED